MPDWKRYIKLYREPRDLWIGVYIGDEDWDLGTPARTIYVCAFTFVMRFTLVHTGRTT
jgi:hypothetical protein